jgi:hypothetical protein
MSPEVFKRSSIFWVVKPILVEGAKKDQLLDIHVRGRLCLVRSRTKGAKLSPAVQWQVLGGNPMFALLPLR